jgi:hypothetical protein
MMDAVHARCDEDQVQNSFHPNWQAPIRMMKQCGRLKGNEENHQQDWTNPEQDHRQGKKADGKNHFAKVKSRGGAYIEV